jgi:hypothetical protein
VIEVADLVHLISLTKYLFLNQESQKHLVARPGIKDGKSNMYRTKLSRFDGFSPIIAVLNFHVEHLLAHQLHHCKKNDC